MPQPWNATSSNSARHTILSLALLATLISIFTALKAWPYEAEIQIDVATLQEGPILAEVNLPYVLKDPFTVPTVEPLVFKAQFSLRQDGEPYAIYIPKVSVKGELSLNGTPIGSCAIGTTWAERCLHRGSFWFPEPELFIDGKNEITMKVWGDNRQTVGLSQIYVGPATKIQQNFLLPEIIKRAISVGVICGSALLGAMALLVGARLRNESVLVSFGFASIANAIASINSIAVTIPVSEALYAWFSFSSRYVSIGAALLMFLTAFELQEKRRDTVKFICFLIFVGPLVTALSDSNRSIVLAAYIPLMLSGFYVVFHCALAARQLRTSFHWILCGGLLLLAATAVGDFIRLSGNSAFVGSYYFGYTFMFLLFAFGWAIFVRFTEGVRLTRGFHSELEQRVAARTEELTLALTTIRNLETSALRLTENIPVGTFVLKDDGLGWMRFEFFSSRLRKIFNLTHVGAMPQVRDLVSQVSDEYRSDLISTLKNCLQSGDDFAWEGPTSSPVGVKWIGIKALRNDDPTGQRSWAGVCTDLTDVHAAEERLKEMNQRLLEAAITQSKEEERERLMQEIHDGFGSQLASARLAIQFGKLSSHDIARILEECTIDLQLVVDAIGNINGSFADILADFQDRTRRRLARTDMDIEWDLCVPEDTAVISPTSCLRIIRIIQEALNNALRHSGAKKISLQVRALDKAGSRVLSVSIRDNGKGFATDYKPQRGMSNMRRRARELGAQLNIEGTPLGVTVHLEIGY